MRNKKTIGIIGGMGPFASCRMVDMVLKVSRDMCGAKKDEDFPEILLISIPVKNFYLNTSNSIQVLNEINSKVKIFKEGKVEVFGIACNIAHLIADKINIPDGVEFVSIINATVNEVESISIKKVGLLASPVTIESRLYQDALEKKGIKVILPNRQQISKLGKIIEELVSLRNEKKNRQLLKEISEFLVANGAEAIILGCTELPLAFPNKNSFPVINTIEVLANKLTEKCYISN